MTDPTAVMCCPLVTWSHPSAVLTHDLLNYQKSYFKGEKNNKTLRKMDMRRLLSVFSKSHTKFHTMNYSMILCK